MNFYGAGISLGSSSGGGGEGGLVRRFLAGSFSLSLLMGQIHEYCQRGETFHVPAAGWLLRKRNVEISRFHEVVQQVCVTLPYSSIYTNTEQRVSIRQSLQNSSLQKGLHAMAALVHCVRFDSVFRSTILSPIYFHRQGRVTSLWHHLCIMGGLTNRT